MPDNLLDMAKKTKKPAKAKGPKKPFPSRLKVKYVQVPKEYWDAFDGMTQSGEKYEDRSVAYLVKMACRAMLQAEGRVDDKGKVIPKPGG